MISRRLSMVSFDAVSTLIKPGAGGVGAQYAAAAEKMAGLRLEPALLQSSFLEEFKRQRAALPNYGYGRDDVTTREWWTQVVVRTFKTSAARGGDFQCDDAILREMASHLYDNFEWDLYPDADLVLRHLKETKGLKLCVISNSDERLSKFLRDKNVERYFDLILTSREAGVEKPDPEIFHRVLRHFGNENVESPSTSSSSLRPEAALHVGDDVICDFEAAKRVGMRALVVDHRRKMTPKDEFVCYDLRELMKKVDDIVALGC